MWVKRNPQSKNLIAPLNIRKFFKILISFCGIILLSYASCSIAAENKIVHAPNAPIHPQPLHKKNIIKKSSHPVKIKKTKKHKKFVSKKIIKHEHKTYAVLNHHLDSNCIKPLSFSENNNPSFASSIEQHLVSFVHSVIGKLHYSHYKLGGTHFDTSRGVYIVDCSDYVNHLLQVIYPNAYLDLTDSMRTDKPTSQLYYDFFNELSPEQNGYWSKVDDAEALQPGDILVFRKKNSYGMARGHVMVVMDKPIRDNDILLLRVTDSAPSAHSEDTRTHSESGIGIGTLLLKMNSQTGQLAAYAWKEGAHWENNVNFAMARPTEAFAQSEQTS